MFVVYDGLLVNGEEPGVLFHSDESFVLLYG